MPVVPVVGFVTEFVVQYNANRSRRPSLFPSRRVRIRIVIILRRQLLVPRRRLEGVFSVARGPRDDRAALVHASYQSRWGMIVPTTHPKGHGHLRGASYSLETVRTAPKSEKKPPTTSSDGHESY